MTTLYGYGVENDRIAGTAHKRVTVSAPAHGYGRLAPDVISCQCAGGRLLIEGIDVPNEVNGLGEPNIDAEAIDPARVELRRLVGANQDTVEILSRTKDEADAAADIATQSADVKLVVAKELRICTAADCHRSDQCYQNGRAPPSR